MKINGFISTVMLTALLLIATLGGITHAQDETDWMPDPNLQQAVREKLAIPAAVPMLPGDLTELYDLVIEHDIRSLQGLEHAVNLKVLVIDRSEVSNLTPLAGLKNLEFLSIVRSEVSDLAPLAEFENLQVLKLYQNRIADITPLAGLINLEVLELQDNQIADISPLAGLVELQELSLQVNQIVDISSLAGLDKMKVLQLYINQISDVTSLSNLTALEHLNLHRNKIVDFTPLVNLKNLNFLDLRDNADSGEGQFLSADPAVIDALRAALCEFERPEYVRSVEDRIENRDYPSICTINVPIRNRPDLTPLKRLTLTDISFSSHPFHELGRLRFERSPLGGITRSGGYVIGRKQDHRDALSQNPNMLFLVAIAYIDGSEFGFTEDSPYWLRNPDGTIAERIWYVDAQGNEYREPLVDFVNPEVQEIIVAQVVAVARCGLYDGIWLDRWNQDPEVGDLFGYVPLEIELAARDQILQDIRAQVREDFLILTHAPFTRNRWASLINGAFFEFSGAPDPGSSEFRGESYTHQDFRNFEKALIWNEANLREPNFTILTNIFPSYSNIESPKSQQTMRTFTTLSLTHSDGYVSMAQHGFDGIWYDFWDAPLGRPIGEKAQLYENKNGVSIKGLFIREFTNGWAVYNRSGKEQAIVLPNQATGVTSGGRKKQHTLPDLDGEIYLRTVVQITPEKYPPLYWVAAKTGTLHRLIADKVKNLVPGVHNATSLTVDAAAGRLYWTEKTDNRTGKIQSANLDGTNVQLVKDLTSIPLDIALDATAGKLYLSNTWGKIQRMNLDGSDFQPNLVTGLKTPQNLVLDTANDKFYWTEQISKTTGKVQRANLDGSNVQLVKKLTSAPRGMTLDVVNRKLYLTNAWGKLQRMNLNGSNFQPNFITGLASPGQVAVDVIGDKVYWTEQGKLRRANLDGGNIQDVIIGLGELTDIALGVDLAGQTGVAAAPMTQTVVEQTSLLANYPNPFNPETWIPYHLANPSNVWITIYDTRGGIVRRLNLGHQQEGYYTTRSRAAYWDGRNALGEPVASGIYFYQLQADNLSFLRKMVILK